MSLSYASSRGSGPLPALAPSTIYVCAGALLGGGTMPGKFDLNGDGSAGFGDRALGACDIALKGAEVVDANFTADF